MNQPMITSRPVLHSQQQTDKSFDPWLLWVTLRRCWHWAVPVGMVLGCLAGFAVLRSFVPRFRASHLLEANKDFILYKGVMPTVDDLAKTESPIVFNHVVLAPVLSDPGLRSAPSLSDPETAEQELRTRLKVSAAGSRARMMVSYEDSDREYAAKICNAVVNSYLRQRADQDQARVSNLEGLLVPEIDLWKREVENQKAKVQQLSEKTLGFNPATQLSTMENQNRLARLDELRSQVGDLEVDIMLLDAKLQVVRTENANPLDDEQYEDDSEEFVEPPIDVEPQPISAEKLLALVAADSEVVAADAEVQRYQRQMNAMQDADMIRINRSRYNELVSLQDEWKKKLETATAEARTRAEEALQKAIDLDYEQRVKIAKAEIEAQRKAFEESKARRARMRRAEMRAEQSDAERELLAQLQEKRNQQKLLEDQYEDERHTQEKFMGDSADLQFAQDDLARATDLLNKLQDRVAAIRTERRQLNAVQSLAVATPPNDPIESLPYKKLLAAGGLGFVIPFAIGLLLEMRTNRVTDSLSLDKYAGLAPVVGELARSPSTNSGRSSKGRRVFQESVDTLRANLFLAKETKDSRSLAIVSSMSGEGKSTAASQLAISLAKASGKTVLLIDADMRCPDQHDIFGLSLEPGLSGVLTGEAELEDAIQTELGDLIHVLPAGRLKYSPHRLMSPEAMKGIVDQALDKYEFVIFDTAPVLSAGETLAVASAVDSTLICAMRDLTRMESVVRTTHRLESAGAKVAGTIFNGVTPRQYAYRYGDYNYSNIGEFVAHSD